MADQFPMPEPLKLVKITDKLYHAVGGFGANTGFFLTKKSIIAIDAKMDRDSSAKSIGEIRKISSYPITHMIITHGDMDHINGLDAFPENMTIISHPATKNDMKNTFNDPMFNHLRTYIPNKTFTENLDLSIDDEKIVLMYIAPAHTSGDILVFFPDYKTVFVGDLVFDNPDPLIHLHKGGTSSGLVKCLKAIIGLNADTILGGHIGSGNKKQILATIDNLIKRRKNIKKYIDEGKNLEGIKAIFNIIDEEPPPGVPKFPSLVETLYNEIMQKKY